MHPSPRSRYLFLSPINDRCTQRTAIDHTTSTCETPPMSSTTSPPAPSCFPGSDTPLPRRYTQKIPPQPHQQHHLILCCSRGQNHLLSNGGVPWQRTARYDPLPGLFAPQGSIVKGWGVEGETRNIDGTTTRYVFVDYHSSLPTGQCGFLPIKDSDSHEALLIRQQDADEEMNDAGAFLHREKAVAKAERRCQHAIPLSPHLHYPKCPPGRTCSARWIPPRS